MASSSSSGPSVNALPDHYQALSRKVYQILEDIGVNVEMRKMMMDTSISIEIVSKTTFQPHTMHIFGSTYEGTKTPGMSSDMDVVTIFHSLPVVTDPADHLIGTYLLQVQDQTTPPGYCKLQLVENGRPVFGNADAVTERLSREGQIFLRFCPDKNNRLVCTYNPPVYIVNLFHSKHGPALTLSVSESGVRLDIVCAFKSNSWPGCASEWLKKQRHFSWPSTDMINLCSTLGCLFVPVGHPDSVEQEKLWRLSLSYQERWLVTSFNSVQLKCYILLKIIKKELIASYIPDSLSSYHIKTCVLYLVENTLPDFWSPDNLLGCVATCLKLLSYWAEIGYCPNYFIPAENMFDRHVRGVVRRQLHHRLQHLISSDCQFLVHIQTCGIGTLLRHHCIPANPDAVKRWNLTTMLARQQQSFGLKVNLIVAIFQSRHLFEQPDRTSLIASQFKKLNDIRNNRLVSGYTESHTHYTLSLVSPYIELSFISNLVASAVQQGKPKEQIWRYLASEKWHALSLQSDSFSSKLKQATFLYMVGYYYPSLDILSSLTGLVRFTLCSCGLNKPVFLRVDELLPALSRPDITVKDLLRNYIVPCVHFPAADVHVTPTALCYEMMRTEGDVNITANSERSDSANVDGIFLLHFLLYLNHSQLNMDSHVSGDLSNMEWLLNSQKVSHRETCQNLLGWGYKEQGHVDRAMECYRSSLEEKPSCNAALLHIRDIEIINNRELC